MSSSHPLATTVQNRASPEFLEKRKMMIQEALNWEGGTRDQPKRYDVGPSDGPTVFFLKPGKEAFRSIKPNVNDMIPLVGRGDKRYRFQDMWVPLASLSHSGDDRFKQVLVLLYRNTFLLDHVETNGVLRYRPREGVLATIDELDEPVRKVWPGGLMQLMCLFDVLGWNEDVKYHSERGRPTFKGKYGRDVGRTNNMLTGIGVVCRVANFVGHVMANAGRRETIDMGMIIEPMQEFANRRGVAPPSDRELLEWLSPYLIDQGR
jgi:hypothetical protein